MKGLAWSSLLALMAACDSGKPPEKAAAPPESKPAAPEPAESRHLVDLGSRDHPAAKAEPADPVAIRFDFSGQRVYAFDFHQRVATASEMGAHAKGPIEQRLTADGTLLMKAKGAGVGTMVIKDLKSRMSMSAEGGPDRSMDMPMPTMVVPDVKEDGSMEGGAASAQPLLKLLFPMPPKPLSKGEAVDVPLSFPFNVMGSPLSVKGSARVTLNRFVVIDDRTCARLDVDIDISKLDIPPEVETKASCSVKGRSVYYWDVERKEFASGETALLMKLKSEGALPKLPEGGPPMPSTFNMKMVSDNLVRLTRNAEKAGK